jgi:hypothetical protein
MKTEQTNTQESMTSGATKMQLLRWVLIAAVIAGILLVIVVLPAEYGIDPTGIGQKLDLKNLSTTTDEKTRPPTLVAALVDVDSITHTEKTIVTKQTVDYRSDTREIVLAPGKGLEIKTRLAKGGSLIYAWKTKNGEKISHDFHGDPIHAKNDEFESFIEEKAVSESKAALIAPFTGVHGWYWKNTTSAPVTVLLQASGFYTEMFFPNGDPASAGK